MYFSAKHCETTMSSKPKKMKESYEKPDVIKYNVGVKYSIYRALEDAGAEIPWQQLSKDHESFTEILKKSTPGFLEAIANFLIEFTSKNNKLSVICLMATDSESWETVAFHENRKRKNFIRQERENGQNFTALFFIKVNLCLFNSGNI